MTDFPVQVQRAKTGGFTIQQCDAKGRPIPGELHLLLDLDALYDWLHDHYEPELIDGVKP